MLAAYRCGYVFFYAAIWLISPFSKKIKKGLVGRKNLAVRIQKETTAWSESPYWFHVASSGELEQCLPVMDELKKKSPDVPIFLSYFSPTAERALELEKKRRDQNQAKIPWDYADFSPLDFPKSVNAFLDALKPKSLSAINREIWPELIYQTRKRGIDCYLFAAYFSPKARRAFGLYRQGAKRFQFIGTTETSSADFLKRELPESKIEVLGDPRIERVLARRDRRGETARVLGDRKIFIAASVWKKDFLALAPSIAMILTEHPAWRIVIVPHEPEKDFIAFLRGWFLKVGHPAVLWSVAGSKANQCAPLIVDTVGQLAELYYSSDLVFVGGSFRAKVHNVLEPAAYAKAIVTGPYIENSGEAVEMAALGAGIFPASNPTEVQAFLTLLISKDELRNKAAEAALSYLNERRGAAQRYAKVVVADPPGL